VFTVFFDNAAINNVQQYEATVFYTLPMFISDVIFFTDEINGNDSCTRGKQTQVTFFWECNYLQLHT